MLYSLGVQEVLGSEEGYIGMRAGPVWGLFWDMRGICVRAFGESMARSSLSSGYLGKSRDLPRLHP